MNINTTSFLVAAGLGTFLPSTANAADSNENKRPNILILQADDMGYDDMSLRGNQCVSTPNLDNLAQISTRFENFYVHTVSAPTRASLLTGRHFLRTGVSGVHGGRDFVNLDEVTIAEAFQQAGYTTGMWGKWHSGKSSGYFPWQRGFDEAYMAALYRHHDNVGMLNGKELATTGWTDAVMADMAIDFIKRNKNREFFAYVPFLEPHGVWDAPEDYIERNMAEGQDRDFATLNSMIEHLDLQVGKILHALEDEGLLENTIVVFLSDNGPIDNVQDINVLDEEQWAQRNPSGYRGRKGLDFENGIHSPLFVYWKGHYESAENNSLLAVYDIFPTLCDIADIDIPSDAKKLDGVSFKKALDKPSKTINNKRTIYFSKWYPFFEGVDANNKSYAQHIPLSAEVHASIDPEIQRVGLHNGDYKALFNQVEDDSLAMWDLSNDYKEKVNLYTDGTKKDRKRTLKYREEAMEWYREVLAEGSSHQMPTFLLGYGDDTFTQVFGYGPYSISEGLMNNAHFIQGFDTKGEFAEYKVNVLRDTEYDVKIVPAGSFKGTAKVKIYTNVSDDYGVIELNGKNSTELPLNLSGDVTMIGIELIEASEPLSVVALNFNIL